MKNIRKNPYFTIGRANANIQTLIRVLEKMPVPEDIRAKIEYEVALEMAKKYMKEEG